jgi:uncharacterized protein YbjT (DUF2867 family)
MKIFVTGATGFIGSALAVSAMLLRTILRLDAMP